jgi:hypothetical protein
MKTILSVLLTITAVVLSSCKPHDPRVNLAEEVRSDTLTSNIVTRPVGSVFSGLIGEGIEVKRVTTGTNEAGFMVLQVEGFNHSAGTKRFEYKTEWVDGRGMVIDSAASAWLPVSARSKSQFSFKSVAPSREAVDFKIYTRKAGK